jgi:GNAT superfamily N-acetyltransferase
MTVTIRPAAPSDVDLLLGFVRELAAYERAPDAVEATPDLLARALFGERPAAEAVIAELDGAPVGFALWFHNFSTWKGRRGLYLEDLYVSPTARGQGVGKALLNHLARIAVERGCARFEWWVLDWNQPAIDFYRAMGAVAMDEWTVQRVEGDALARLAASE